MGSGSIFISLSGGSTTRERGEGVVPGVKVGEWGTKKGSGPLLSS